MRNHRRRSRGPSVLLHIPTLFRSILGCGKSTIQKRIRYVYECDPARRALRQSLAVRTQLQRQRDLIVNRRRRERTLGGQDDLARKAPRSIEIESLPEWQTVRVAYELHEQAVSICNSNRRVANAMTFGGNTLSRALV